MRYAQLRAAFFRSAGWAMFVPAGLLAAVLLFAGPVQAAGKSEVAVMPFFEGRDPANPGRELTCEFGRLYCAQSDLKEDADRILTEMLWEMLVKRLEHRVVPMGTVRRAYDANHFEKADKTPLNAALALGKKLKVDYVLAGNVWRYRERAGSAYGVEDPASVAFTLHLVRMESQRVVWVRVFNETQRSLSENLFRAREFFRRGAKWLTAKELASYGMKDVMGSFPVK